MKLLTSLRAVRSLAVALAVLAGSAACSSDPEPVSRAVRDPHSFANIDAFRTRHIDLTLHVDFDARRLRATADLTLDGLDPRARTVVLDTRDLDVRGAWLVREGDEPLPLEHSLGEPQPPLGQALTLELPESANAERITVRVEYETRPEASGLQWLTPEQTAGGAHPFLFTQSQAIHARSWIPLQDTPQVRATYRATVHTPAGLRAVMSADNSAQAERGEDGKTDVYRFDMPQAIPSYLIALGVGRLEFRSVGPRSGVYAEPSVVEAAAREFADLEDMIEACERMFGPYRWGRYDLLILPPSFPFGGMENPRLSFITPTVIAGDRSLVALIAHELAHSWSGNLVTNATWRDLWLNEGFTTYLERRIVEALYGRRRAQMEDALGLQSLQRDLEDLEPRDEVLAIDLTGRDPDDVFSDVPYEKGKLFIQWLESRLGREQLDEFLKGYFDRFAFQSITTEQFLDHLRTYLKSAAPDAVDEAQLRTWIYEPGLPEFAVLPPGDAFTHVDRARADWVEGRIDATQLPAREWTTHEWLHFLDNLPQQVPQERLAELDRAFGLTEVENAEIAHSWLLVAVRNRYEPAYPRLERYLTTIGRRKLIKPLYEALVETSEGAERARRIYERARPGYHPIAASTIDSILQAAP